VCVSVRVCVCFRARVCVCVHVCVGSNHSACNTLCLQVAVYL
jgi:hypothetical protein